MTSVEGVHCPEDTDTILATTDLDDSGCDVLSGPFAKTGFAINQYPVLPIGYDTEFVTSSADSMGWACPDSHLPE